MEEIGATTSHCKLYGTRLCLLKFITLQANSCHKLDDLQKFSDSTIYIGVSILVKVLKNRGLSFQS